MTHPRIEQPKGSIRNVLNRVRHLLEPRGVASTPPAALPGEEIPEWSVERGRGELESLLSQARRNSQR